MTQPSRSRWSNPLSEPNALVGPGAVLYDTRNGDRRSCCDRGGRCLAHVVGVYEETSTDEVCFRVQDGTHTTEHWCHQGDLLALYEPAGWSVDTAVKPTYALTRRHGVEDHHDRMTDNGESAENVETGIRYAKSPVSDTYYRVTEWVDCGEGKIEARKKHEVDDDEVPEVWLHRISALENQRGQVNE